MPVIRYDDFGGVDFSHDISAVHRKRSPDALNVIPDEGGCPEKRVGYRKLHGYPGRINGIFPFNNRVLVHSGDSIYNGEALLLDGLTDGKSTSCVFCDKLWILTGGEFLVYDGETLNHVKDVATVPQVLSQTDNMLKGGFTYQPFNMLTARRRVGITIPKEGMNVFYIYQRVK